MDVWMVVDEGLGKGGRGLVWAVGSEMHSHTCRMRVTLKIHHTPAKAGVQFVGCSCSHVGRLLLMGFAWQIATHGPHPACVYQLLGPFGRSLSGTGLSCELLAHRWQVLVQNKWLLLKQQSLQL
jgi:hypothetical protein